MKSHEKVKLVGDKSFTLAVAPMGAEFLVLVFGTKTTAVATSDCRLLNVGVKV